jgi:hypothetical protein
MAQKWFKTAEQFMTKWGYLVQPTKGYSWQSAPVAIYLHKDISQMNKFFDFAQDFVSNGDHVIIDSKLNGSSEHVKAILKHQPRAWVYQKNTAEIPSRVDQSLKEKILGIIHVPIVVNLYTTSDLKKLVNSIDDLDLTAFYYCITADAFNVSNSYK